MGSRYRLTGRLEGGELAELYRAQRDDDQPVVVKLFHPQTSDQRYARVIADTARLMQNVLHPGVCHVLQIGTVRKRLAIVREDPGGFNLGQVLQRLNTKEVVLAPSLAMSFVIELLECVQQAHDALVVHGALTPGNVLMSKKGRPAVCDFGALSALNSSAALKKNFGARGRSAYRGPELQKGESPSVQSDIYSLGAMAYELLTLREAQISGVKTRHEDLPPPSRLDRRLSSRLDPVLMRALETAPTRRYRAPSEMAGALRDYLTANGGMASRGDLEKFVGTVFPNDVVIEAAGTVPFDDWFTLDEVTGAGLEEADERSMVISDRRAFSRALEETDSAGLAADLADEETPPASAPGSVSVDWVAPPSTEPLARSRKEVELASADVMKRMRRVEDFDEASNVTQLELPAMLHDTIRIEPLIPRPSPVKPVAVKVSPLIDLSVSQQIDRVAVMKGVVDTDEIQVSENGRLRRLMTEERKIVRLLRDKRKWLPFVAASALLAAIVFAYTLSRMRSGEVVLPETTRPIVRSRPLPEPRSPRRDAPDKPKDDRPAVPTGGQLVLGPGCYNPGKRATGFLAISDSSKVTVFIDGDKVCGAPSKLAVPPGNRKISVVDKATRDHYETDIRIEAGKTARFIPLFKNR